MKQPELVEGCGYREGVILRQAQDDFLQKDSEHPEPMSYLAWRGIEGCIHVYVEERYVEVVRRGT